MLLLTPTLLGSLLAGVALWLMFWQLPVGPSTDRNNG
jgi:hypothetical protein